MKRDYKNFHQVIVGSFFAALCLPGIAMIFFPAAEGDLALAENRTLSALPSRPASVHEWIGWPRVLEAYYRDQFGFRQEMLAVATNVRHRLGLTIDTLYMTGRDNWVFLRDYNITGGSLLDQLRGARPLDDETLALFAKRLGKIEKRLTAQGIDLMLSFVPEKHSIYWEYMPVNVRRVGPSRLDQMNSLLLGSAYYFDAKSVLVAARKAGGERPLYYVMDSHWNCWGAYLVYRGMLEQGHGQRRLNLPILPEQAVAYRQLAQFDDRPRSPKYWLRQFGDNDSAFECLVERDPGINMQLLNGGERFTLINGERELPETEYPGRPVLYEAWHARNASADVGMRAIVVRDSYASYLIPYINRSFSEVVYLHYDSLGVGDLHNMIERLEPDMVILAYAERALSQPLAVLHKLNLILSSTLAARTAAALRVPASD